MDCWVVKISAIVILLLPALGRADNASATEHGARENPTDVFNAATEQIPTHREGFSFLHTYESTGRYWLGLEKAGLLRPTNGIRLVNSPWSDERHRFNEVARPGGPLWQVLEQRKCNFVVDRVVGGSMYSPYAFDGQLIDRYTALLGDRFLGGQVHEPGSNTCSDWYRFTNASKEYASKPIDPQDPVLRDYFHWNDVEHWLDYGTLDDYAGRVRYNTPASFWREVVSKGRQHAARFNGRFAYCEGSEYGRFAWHLFYKCGATSCLAEVGVWASSQTPLMIAALRGAAKAAGKPWGVVYTAWGPGGGTSFIPVQDNSWRITKKALNDSKWPVGPELGCSTAMQRRVLFHAYLSGAHTLQEEWGAEYNLLAWDEGTLSSSGKVTRDLLDFQDGHPDVGEPYTPIALVVDATVPPPRDNPIWNVNLCQQLFRYADADNKNASRPGAGTPEVGCYPPCALPEVFDVVPSDAPESLWRSYTEIIPVETSQVPASAKPCRSEEVYGRLADAVERLSPFARLTHLPMQINCRASDRTWIVALYNPWGAVRGDVYDTGSILDEGCAIEDIVQSKFAIASVRVIHAWPSSSGTLLEGGNIHVKVGPGGTLVLQITQKE